MRARRRAAGGAPLWRACRVNAARRRWVGERSARAAKRIQLLAVLLVTAVLPLAAPPQVRTGSAAGALLYETHCIACHTTQVHWRDQRLATDWTTLSAQVRRWQTS